MSDTNANSGAGGGHLGCDLAAPSSRDATVDLVWDESLGLKVAPGEVEDWLGMAKYEPILTAVYAGLCIPPALLEGTPWSSSPKPCRTSTTGSSQ